MDPRLIYPNEDFVIKTLERDNFNTRLCWALTDLTVISLHKNFIAKDPNNTRVEEIQTKVAALLKEFNEFHMNDDILKRSYGDTLQENINILLKYLVNLLSKEDEPHLSEIERKKLIYNISIEIPKNDFAFSVPVLKRMVFETEEKGYFTIKYNDKHFGIIKRLAMESPSGFKIMDCKKTIKKAQSELGIDDFGELAVNENKN